MALICSTADDVEVWSAGKPMDIRLRRAYRSEVTARAENLITTGEKDSTENAKKADLNQGEEKTPTKTLFESFEGMRTEEWLDGKATSKEKPRSAQELKRGASWTGDATIGEAKKRHLSEAELRDVLVTKIKGVKDITRSQRTRLQRVIMKNIECFSSENRKVGLIKDIKISFNMTDLTPSFTPERPRAPAANAEITRQAEEWLEDGLIQPTTSRNNFPIVLISKGPGQPPRAALDLRKFNKKYVGEWYPIAQIRDIVAEISQSTLFTALDAQQAFHALELHDADGVIPSSHQLAFTLSDGRRFSWVRMPFGCSDATYAYSRALAEVIRDMRKNVQSYVDDLILHDKEGVNNHITVLDKLLTRLREQGVLLKATKCDFLVKEVKILGMLVSHTSVRPQEDKMDTVKDLAPPRNREELQSCLGVLGWHRQFIEGFADKAKPPTRLLQKENPVKWPECFGAEEERCFKELQAQVLAEASLAAVDFTKAFEIWCDASKTGIGGVLVQRDEDNKPLIVENWSKQLTEQQTKWNVQEREAYAVLKSVHRFRQLLCYGPRFAIVVRSDHAGLTSLYKNANESSKLYQWAMELSEYDYTIKWHAGKCKEAQLPDHLSRARMQPATGTATVDQMVVTIATTDQRVAQLLTPIADRLQSLRSQTMQQQLFAECKKTNQCSRRDRHTGQCNTNGTREQRRQAEAGEERYVIDHLVTRARRTNGGVPGFRVSWKGFEEKDETYQTHQQLQQDLNRQELDGLKQDLEHRETLGQVSVTLSATDLGFSNWTDYVGDAAAGKQHKRTPALRPFPTAEQRSDSAFATFDAISVDQLANEQQTEEDTQDIIIRVTSNKQHTPKDITKGRPSFMADVKNVEEATRHWGLYADSCHVDEETKLLMRSYTPSKGVNQGIPTTVIVLPQKLITRALTYAHECAGHHGTEAIQWVMRTRFTYRFFAEWIDHHVKPCPTCRRAEPHATIPHQLAPVNVQTPTRRCNRRSKREARHTAHEESDTRT